MPEAPPASPLSSAPAAPSSNTAAAPDTAGRAAATSAGPQPAPGTGQVPDPQRGLTPRVLLWASIAIAVVTIALKTTAWYLTGSVGLLSDAMESFVNLASAVFALAMLTVALRPADDKHPFGHHKAEYFSSGFEGILIVGVALGIFWTAGHRLWQPQPLVQVGWGLALSLLSSALNGALAWLMFRSARAHRSIALEADARHLVTDVWTSAGVLLGLVGVMLTGWLWLDAVAAMLVALNILKEGVSLVWRSSQGLMDEALEPEVQRAMEAALTRFAQHHPVRFDHLITRRAGQRRFASLHMHLPADWRLRDAAQLRAQVEQSLMETVPGLRAVIELLPADAEVHRDRQEDFPATTATISTQASVPKEPSQ